VIDRRTEQKLKRGRMEIDATLDLHGLKQQAAHFRLMHFIARAFDDGHKAVLVITGKGAPRGEEAGIMPSERRGVLRVQVPLWLEQAPLCDYVRGIKSAGPRHGGAGALYVLIKRKR
jgi:DNA-nicking Smr family endonuclease